MAKRWVWAVSGGCVLVLALVVLAYGWVQPPSSARSSEPLADDRPDYIPTSPTASAAPGAAPSPESAATGQPARVLYLGDSLAMESQDVLGRSIEEAGQVSYRSAPYSGTTLCDYLESSSGGSLVPEKDKAAALVRSFRPGVVVLQFWGNAWGYTPCMGRITSGTQAYYDRYAADAKALTNEIAASARRAGIPRPRIVWVLQGPDAFNPDRIRKVNDIYRAQATATDDLLSDAGSEVSRANARYTHVQHLPCNAHEREQSGFCTGGTAKLHRDDDLLHFCLAPTTSTPKPCPRPSPGIDRYTKAIAATVTDYLKS